MSKPAKKVIRAAVNTDVSVFFIRIYLSKMDPRCYVSLKALPKEKLQCSLHMRTLKYYLVI